LRADSALVSGKIIAVDRSIQEAVVIKVSGSGLSYT
jgi:hypothetical protein